MDYDLKIANAVIVDGTGAPQFAGSLGIRHGRIAAIGAVHGDAAETIDAGGAVVAPGFIDCHTHYDAQICWDHMLAPSVYHGVTTIIAGNCGLTLAPLTGKAEDLDYLLGMLANVEGMPAASLRQAVKPEWQSFGEFLDHFDGKLAINTAFMVGHSALRRHVMGERAVGNEATPGEIAAMEALLRQSLSEGGMGFSTGVSVSHSDHNGDPVPSRWASREEIMTLSAAVRDFPGTFVEIVPGVGPFGEKDYELVTAMSLAAQRPLNWNALFVDMRRKPLIDSQLAMGRFAATRGAKVYGLAPGGPVKGYLNFRSGFTFDMLDGWKPFLRLPIAERIAAMKDPDYRARLKAGANNPANPAQVLQGLEHYCIEDVRTAGNAPWRGKTIGEFAAARDLDPFDALFDLAIEEDLWLIFSGPAMGTDAASWNLRKQVWDDPHVLLGGSDAGAHLDLFCTFALTTQLLGEAVRTRGELTLEDGVRRVTGDLADAFGLKGRGRIEVGAHADLVVFDPETIDCGPVAMRADLPGGESRLYADAVGIRHVVVNGVPVAEGNRPTGRLGGKVLRSGADSFTVSLT
jgi:N-acyl-D-aspartate/D-glutamate deacylase